MTAVLVECRSATDLEDVLARAAFVELAGIEELNDGQGARLWLAEPGAAAELCRRLSDWKPRIEEAHDDEPGRNWNEAWQREWQPILVGQCFLLVPPGDTTTATPPGRIRLALHAGNAFGNGDHATTHLCLAAMEDDLPAGGVFLDIGCGSGLLGEAAAALGARRAWGCDIVPGLGSFTGSVNAVRSGSCDYVVANIQLGVLVELLPDIRRVMRSGGARGVLSGVLIDQAGELEREAEASGLECSGVYSQGDWAAVRIVRR